MRLAAARTDRAAGGAIRRLILGFACVAPVALVLLWPRSPLAGIAILALSHALILYPTLRPNLQWLGPVVTRFDTTRKEIWLTIDDGPADDTLAVLDLFDRHEVKATFFVKGILAQERPELVQEMLRRGHTVANHSHTHPSFTFWCLPPRRVQREIDDCNRVLRSLVEDRQSCLSSSGTNEEGQAGLPVLHFRAPVGHKNPFVHPALARRGMRLIGWTARAFDAVVGDPERVVRQLLPHLAPGAIIVLHQGLPHSLRVLERAVAAIRERGYDFVIPENASLRNTNR